MSNSFELSNGSPRARWNSALAYLRMSAISPFHGGLRHVRPSVRTKRGQGDPFSTQRNTASHRYLRARLGPRLVMRS